MLRISCALFLIACGSSAVPDGGTDARVVGIDSGSIDSGSPLSDAGSDGGSDGGSEPIDAGPPCGDYTFQNITGTSGGVSFELHRCMGGPICAGGCDAYAIYYRLDYDGGSHVADRRELITYNRTHHNWTDNLVAMNPDQRTYWRVMFDFEGAEVVERMFVRAETLDGTRLLEEIEVTPR
jgi:hypothetical protein